MAPADTNRLVKQTSSEVQIATSDCLLTLRPLTASALRVRCAKPDTPESASLILTEPTPAPPFKVMKRGTSLILMTDKMQAIFDRNTGALQFADRAGKPFLSGIAGTRRLEPSTVQASRPSIAEQAFASPARRASVRQRRVPGWISRYSGPSPPAHAGELAESRSRFCCPAKGTVFFGTIMV